MDYDQWIKLDTASQLEAVVNAEFVFVDTVATRYISPEAQTKKASAFLDALKVKSQEAATPDEKAIVEWEAYSKFRQSVVQSFNPDTMPKPESKKVLGDLDLMRGLNDQSSNADRIVIAEEDGTVTFL